MPPGLLGALALIAAVEWSIATHRGLALDASRWEYANAREVAASRVKDCGVLAFGDSLMKHGFAPRVIRDRAGLAGYNLAIAGSQAPASYFLLRDALASGSRPRFVLVDYFPCLLSSDPWADIGNWPLLADYRDCLEMARLARDPELLAALMLRKTLPSAGCREAIRSAIREGLLGWSGSTAAGVRAAARHGKVNRGLAIGDFRYDPDASLDSWILRLFRPINCTPLNRIYVDRFMDLAASHGIRVILVLPPYMPALEARLEQLGFNIGHDALIRKLLERHPGLDVLDARKSNFDLRAFIDIDHLGYAGATSLSSEIGEVLRRELEEPGSVPRWASLPEFRWWPLAAPHESADASRIAVDLDRRVRR